MLHFQTLLWSSVTRSCFGTDGLLDKDTISRARYARQLGHTGGNREPPSNLPNLHRSVEAPRANPRPRPRYNVLLRLHHRSGANLIRMLAGLRSLPLQARLHRLRRPHLHGSGSSSARSRASGCTAGHYAAYGGRGRGCTRSPLPCTS